MEIKCIKDQLDFYSDSYYNKSISVVSDADFDMIKSLYEELSGEPYNQVGYRPISNELKKVSRDIPMLSLDKIKSEIEVKKWFKNKFKNEIYLMPKLDGVSLELKYLYGVLVQGVTRGNGLVGEDVTHNALRIKSIPNFCKRFSKYSTIFIRGEVLINKENFAKIKSKSDEFVSARNLASGTLRLKDSSKIDERYPEFIAYEVFQTNRYNYNFEKQLLLLQRAGFNVIDNNMVFISDDRDCENLINNLLSFKDLSNKYEIDGAVIRLNNKKVCRNLGENDYSPKWSFAYKFANQKAKTCIKDIKWQVSHTGRINPVAILKPVEVSGVLIKQASLHNLDYIKNLNLKKNCTVIIERANDVIPYICKALKNGEGEFEIPKKCPSCNSFLEIGENKQFLYCKNKKCISILEQKILLFFNILDVKGVGAIAAKNIAEDLSFNDLNELSLLSKDVDYFINIVKSKKNGVKIYNNLQNVLESLNDYQALALLGIPGISVVLAKIILKHFEFNKLIECSVDDFNSINGIGDKLSSDLFNSLKDEYILERFSVLSLYIRNNISKKKVLGTNFNGKKFCITGTLPVKRKDLIKTIEDHNGQYTNTVSGQTDFLITARLIGNKIESAQRLGVKCITYEEFLELIS